MAYSLESLKAITSLEKFTTKEQIDILGTLFDLSLDNSSVEGIEHGLQLAQQIDLEAIDDENYTVLNYDLSNAWSYLRKIKYQGKEGDWNFQMEELTKEILHLRKAISSPGFSKVPIARQCQIYTNIGSAFSYIGRFVEAQEYWNNAICLMPEFSMATGNKANGLFYYARILYDNIHCNLFLVFAYHILKTTLKNPEYLYPDAEVGFKNLHDYLETTIKQFPTVYLRDFPNLNTFDLGPHSELREYRQWCLDNKLFINPLNDLGNYNDASHDCLNLPTLVISTKRPPVFLNLFNQIKQEYATARYSFYYSTLGLDTHVSDIDVPLVETMETVRYSYYVEQLKISFRLAYSILDKLAYLLNDYLELKIESHKVSFRTLWYTNQKMILRPFFVNSDNWALRGLYWLSKDLYEKENDFGSVLEPEAQEIAKIRNSIEHKGFKVLSDFLFFEKDLSDSEVSYTIKRKDFEKKTLRLLKLTRAAIMYSALAISHEEQKKEHPAEPMIPIGSSLIPPYMRI